MSYSPVIFSSKNAYDAEQWTKGMIEHVNLPKNRHFEGAFKKASAELQTMIEEIQLDSSRFGGVETLEVWKRVKEMVDAELAKLESSS